MAKSGAFEIIEWLAVGFIVILILPKMLTLLQQNSAANAPSNALNYGLANLIQGGFGTLGQSLGFPTPGRNAPNVTAEQAYENMLNQADETDPDSDVEQIIAGTYNDTLAGSN